MANADPISILDEVLRAAAGVDPYVIIHFERRGDTFRVWPHDNGEPFSVAIVDERDELVEVLTRQAREGDEAVAALARIEVLCKREQGRTTAAFTPVVPVSAVLRAISGEA